LLKVNQFRRVGIETQKILEDREQCSVERHLVISQAPQEDRNCSEYQAFNAQNWLCR
jgi:hypothetical protein